MDGSGQSGIDYSQLIPAIQTGLTDGFNPCGLATLLIFISVMSAIAHKPRHVCVYGGLFVVASVAFQIFSALGAMDLYMMTELVARMVRYTYILLAIAFLYLGLVHVYDWMRFKKYNDTACFKIRIPAFLNDYDEKRPKSVWKRIRRYVKHGGLVILISAGMTSLSAIYPQSEYIFIVHSYMMSGGNLQFVRWAFFLYAVFMSAALIIVWTVIWGLSFYKHKREAVITFYKGVLSALSISTSCGLLYYFLK